MGFKVAWPLLVSIPAVCLKLPSVLYIVWPNSEGSKLSEVVVQAFPDILVDFLYYICH